MSSFENNNKKTRAYVFVSGVVQGVFFRDSTKQMAERLNITGWVRNLTDGRVEAVFEGEKENIREMLEWAEKGPPSATVENMDVRYKEHRGEFQDFRIL